MLRHLSGVEEPNAEADVPVRELTMTGRATQEAVFLRPTKARLIDEPLRRSRKPQPLADGEDSEDSLDGWMPPDSIPSSKGSVETDLEDNDNVEEEEGSEGEHVTVGRGKSASAATGAREASPDADTAEGIESGSGDEQPRRARHVSGTYVVWTNGYFFIRDHPEQKYLRILMYGHWAREDQMGNDLMSKQLVPSQFGEARNDPRRTQTLLRAWALWRMRQSIEWLAGHSCRHRQYARDEAELVRDVRAFPGHITGDPEADGMLQYWALDVVARL
jgi:hypothetical protein